MRQGTPFAFALVVLVAPLQARAAECHGHPTSAALEGDERFRSRTTDTMFGLALRDSHADAHLQAR